MTNPQKQKNKLIQAIPLERLYVIHRDIRSYHHKWDKNQAVELVDLSIIDDFYTGVQQFIRIGSVVGAGLYLGGYSTQGGTTAVVGLCIDLMASSYKEKFYQPEERKQKRNKLNSDTENLTNSYLELIEILKPIYTNNSLGNLGRVIDILKKEAVQLIENDSKELSLLNSSPKIWTPKGLWSRLRISQRKWNPAWEEWKDKWEARRSEQEKVKELIVILQEAVSRYRQGIDDAEIESGMGKKMLELKLVNEVQIENILIEEKKEVIDIDRHFEMKDKYEQEQELTEKLLQEAKIEVSTEGLNK